jgi:hypothetical protein
VAFVAGQFYDRVTNKKIGEATCKEFLSVCPPIRALVYATFVPWYNIAVRRHDFPSSL